MEISDKPYSLLEFNRLLKETLFREFPREYWVIAEIGDMKVNQSGHCYIDLVEKQDHRILAKSRAAIWASTYYQLAPWFESKTGEPIKPGMKVMASVRINFHELYGLSLTINHLDPSFTMGERARKRQEVLEQIKKEGLFDLNRSLTLPMVPQNIAIISSPTAAGYEDFQNELENNVYGYQFKTTLYPATLQGEGSMDSIIRALKKAGANEQHDVVAIIRGGGSQLDLDTFDSYELAVAIAGLPHPLLTGIGHDRDETIADLLSFQKLKTPTATAQFLVERIAQFEGYLIEQFERIRQLSQRNLGQEKENLTSLRGTVKLSSLRNLDQNRAKLEASKVNLSFLTKNRLIAESHKVQLMSESLKQHDPELILQKGYSISTVEGKLIHQIKNIEPGQKLKTIGRNKIIESTIENIEDRNE